MELPGELRGADPRTVGLGAWPERGPLPEAVPEALEGLEGRRRSPFDKLRERKGFGQAEWVKHGGYKQELAPPGSESRLYNHNQEGVELVEETRGMTRELLK